MNKAADTLAEHMKQYLGTPHSSTLASGVVGGVELSLLRFRDQPCGGASTLVSLGLSDILVNMRDSAQVRQELMICVYDRFLERYFYDLIISIANSVITRRQGLLRGSTLGRPEHLRLVARFHALYCAIAAYFPEGFDFWRGSIPETMMVWLVPISHNEALFADRDWKLFESLLVERDPDLLDLERDSIG